MRARTLLALLLVTATGCTRNLDAVRTPTAVPVLTAWPWESMIYAARTDAGVVLFDLGWYGGERALDRALAHLGAELGDVTDVFVTHSHRDHVAGWRHVRHARFHLHQRELPHFLGEGHRDLPSRLGDVLLGEAGPWEGELNLLPFSGDTAWVVGADTIRAFGIPGHTAGSTAYLFRGILLVGDGVHRFPLTGYGPALPIFTAEVEESRRSLASLFERTLPRVEWVCTAHGKCVRPDERFLRKVLP